LSSFKATLVNSQLRQQWYCQLMFIGQALDTVIFPQGTTGQWFC